MKLLAWFKTDPGQKRTRNEDNLLVDLDVGLLAVADGMGGHQAGATASQMVLEALHHEVSRRLQGPDVDPATTMDLTPVARGGAVMVMHDAALGAGRRIYDRSHADPSLAGMGTTLTATLFDGDRLHLVHVGDSRAYLLRDRTLRQLTHDHSWVAEQVRAGTLSLEQAKASRFRHVITRSVGFEPDIDCDSASVTIEAGDLLLLCSDGLSNYIEHPELEQIMAGTYAKHLPEVLVALANQRGGEDNITVVVGRFANDALAL